MEKIKAYELVCYNTDRSRMKGRALNVEFPKNSLDVQNIVLKNNNLVPRGLGRNIVGGCIPNNSIVIDMKKMNKILFDAKSKTVYAESGVTIKELNEKLKSVNYEFPIITEGTIGGVTAIDSIGLYGKFGRAKDWVEEIELVDGRGELIKIGKADINDVCGMEGITGVITKVKLKLIPLNKKSSSIFQSKNLDEIFSISKRLRLDDEVIMIRFYSPYVSKLLGFPEKYHLIVAFNTDRGKIKNGEFENLLNKLRKDYFYLSANKYYDSEDPKLFFDKVREFVSYLDRLKVPYFGDLILSIIYPFFKNEIIKEEVRKTINQMNGKPSTYGIGLKRKKLLDENQKKIIKRVRLRYDPFGKINRGKVIDYLDSEGVEMEYDKVKHKPEEEILDSDKDEINYEEIEEIPKEEIEGVIEGVQTNEIISKSPEEELEGFIESVESEEKFIDVSETELREKLEDYRETFCSELSDENKGEIEQFAKDIPREILKKEGNIIRDNLESKSDIDFGLINSIMLNNYEGKDIIDDKKNPKNKLNEKKDENESRGA